MTRIGLFQEFCAEWSCWDKPFSFANAHSRFRYFQDDDAHPTRELFDDTRCEVTLLAGLPGSGKTTWAGGVDPDSILSLDDIRDEMEVDPGENQAAVVSEAYDRAKAKLRRCESFVWNATNISKRMRDKVIGLCIDYKARVAIRYFEPPIPVLRLRNIDHPKPVPSAVWEKLFDKLDVPTLAEAYRVEHDIGQTPAARRPSDIP